MGRRGAKQGDIIELVPQRYVSEEVWVESITDNLLAEKYASGSFAIFIKKRKEGGVVVMTESGLLGWVYDDEWRTPILVKGDS